MNLDCRVVDDVVIVKVLDSRIEASSLAGFRDALDPYVERGLVKLLIDLQSVDFIDSSGLGALIALFKRLPEHGTLAICSTRERVQRLFKLTRLNKVFVLCEDEADGLAKLAQEGARAEHAHQPGEA